MESALSTSVNLQYLNTSVKTGQLQNYLTDTETSMENEKSPKNCAVFVRNVCKRYDIGLPILENFCMNVQKGTIYGLLGSSGCGKTTILSCIVGLQECDSGELRVFGKKPGTKGSGIPGKRLGYMPQELALYHHLTTREIIQFYGIVYKMSSSEINDQWNFLNTLLKLPSHFTLIGDLSGGQKRRVSLALALIHSPELLILDEPTVGLDPLLRTDIWDYLYKIVQKLGTTIIITTHYIEEARNSNTIGVMRNGRLMVENSPSSLLRMYNCELLEQVVLKLCREDLRNLENMPNNQFSEREGNETLLQNLDMGSALSNTDEKLMTDGDFNIEGRNNQNKHLRQIRNDGVKDNGVGSKLQCSGLIHTLQRIYGFTTVLLMTYIRHPLFIGTTLFMPCVQGSLTLLCVGSKPRGMHVGIVNHELANWTFECDAGRHHGNSCDFSALSCKFLNELRKDDIAVLSPYDSESYALSQVQLGKISGYIMFPHNFSQHTLDLITTQRFASNESIDGSRIHVHLDYSQSIQAKLLMKHLFFSYFHYIKDTITSCDIGGQQAELPMVFRKPLIGKEDDYTTYIIPGVVLASIIAIGFALTGIMLVLDRKQATLSRAHVAGLTTGDVLTSHLITAGIMGLGQLIIWDAILYFGFSFQSKGSQLLMIVFCLLTQLCGSALGLLAAQMFDEAKHILSTAIFLFTIFLNFTGAIFPMEFMSKFWINVAYLVPTTVPTLSLRSVIVHGIGITHTSAWSGLVVLVAWTVFLLFCSVVIYKKFNK